MKHGYYYKGQTVAPIPATVELPEIEGGHPFDVLSYYTELPRFEDIRTDAETGHKYAQRWLRENSGYREYLIPLDQ